MVIPPIKWEDLYQRPQQIASILSKKFTILWIDKPTFFFLEALIRALLGKLKLTECISDNFYIYRTFTFIPFSRVKIIRKINDILWLLLIDLYGILFFRKVEDTIYLVGFPLDIHQFKGTLLVYDRCDRFYKFKGASKTVFLNDIKLMKKARLVINSSYNLYKEATMYNKNSVVIRNGVDLALLKETRRLSKETNKKVIGFIGAVSSWLDFKLLKKLAKTYQEYDIHVVGPIGGVKRDQDLIDLRRMENVKFFGKVSHDKLPTYLKEFNIGIVPFIVNELTEAVDPVKVYEYMAAGKPVVTTNLPELYRLKDYIYIAKNKDEFIEFCRQAIENPKISSEQLTKTAMENTWERRVEQIEREICKMVPECVMNSCASPNFYSN